VVVRGRPGSANSPLAARATRSMERLWDFARPGGSGFPPDAPRVGAGRCRIRQREESHLYPLAARGPECDPRQSGEDDLARVWGMRAAMRQVFPRQLYRRRALIETLFSSVRRKLSARAPGRSLRMQVRQALLLGLSLNLYRLKHVCLSTRMSTEPNNFYNQSKQCQALRVRFAPLRLTRARLNASLQPHAGKGTDVPCRQAARGLRRRDCA